ncbi:PD-(D/E)XK nuclease family protein [Acuticoccus mangrovi]|uniref:PD-(D/E)XK nuclease family protein n=1 Tax=Acuticoccus mangrovi TaxID=2796142 RepID=A0A934IRC1_9HYPH|nr:PD-(D/E)XK nuclease family protein [Acuticoccus mangrovi]MBJ3776842.1 PD-(D/E)XK nuclease family protein [Acuticoccus mangrovi]
MRVYSVDPGEPFLGTLAARVADGTLWPGGVRPDDPLALADVTIYLPTQRAARALAGAFLDVAGGPTALPRIRGLGDAEDEPLAGAAIMGLTEARVVLASLIRSWAAALERAPRAEEGARVLVPSAGPDAVRLADDLIALLEQVETQEADWADLHGLVERADLAEHWQITTEFLEIATGTWPDHLAQVGKVTAATARRMEAEAAAAEVEAAPGPIIVAGSTGSIPATRRLIRAIAESPMGVVVLPGFDRTADGAAWSALQEATDAPGHPQYGMKQLVDALGLAPAEVVPLAAPEPAGVAPARTRLMSAALKPAPATGAWLADRDAIGDLAGALDGVALVEAADEREEAAAIALAMREAVALGERVALVTPHRPLARRVSHALKRWQIAVDDSGGDPLGATPAGILARLVASVALGGGAAEWLALLKHPAASFGLDAADKAKGVAKVERLLRGPRIGAGKMHGAMLAAGEEAARLAEWVMPALAPLARLAGRDAGVGELARAHGRAFAAVVRTLDTGDADTGAADMSRADTADARAVADLFAELGPRAELTIPAGDWPATFDTLMRGIVVRSPPRDDAVRILGPLEARLQAFDHAILGGLNEGTWPQLPDAGPWMSRGMMSDFGIDLPERRIGLSAHDFVMAAHAPRVTLTRAKKAAGEPTVASRWWQRLTAFAGEGADAAVERGRRYLDLARRIETRPRVDPPRRPAPTPPLAARPTALRVTEVARLVRDPYAVYARRVLGLEPLDPLEADPTAGDRGELMHAVMARFVGEGHHRGGDAEARFAAVVDELLGTLDHAPEAQALWGARLKFIAAGVIEAERGRPPSVHHVEVPVRHDIAGGLELSGRIDRMDIGPDGRLEVIDYKTGRAPTRKEVATFFEPQLPLEAALVAAGAVEGVPADIPLAALTYVALGAGREPVAWQPVAGDDAADLAAETMARLVRLVAHYRDPSKGYLSRARLQFGGTLDGDYDHLARAAEWQNG